MLNFINKLKKMKKLIVIISVLVLGTTVMAQHDLQFITMNRAVQSYYINPAAAADSPYGGHVSGILVPIIGQLPPSMYIHVQNSAFNWSNIFHYGKGKKSGDGPLYLDIDNFMSSFNKAKSDQIRFSTHIDLFDLGFRGKSGIFWTVNLTEKINFAAALPYDLCGLILDGNGPYMRENKAVDMTKLGLDFTVYTEFGVGAGFKLGDKVNVGIRGKFLLGHANVGTDIKKLTMMTDNENYNLTFDADATARMSLPLILAESSVFSKDSVNAVLDTVNMKDAKFYLKHAFGNYGGAADIGISYKPIEQLNVFLSVKDLGAIRWNNNSQQIQSKGKFVFEGVLVKPLESDTATFEDLIKEIPKRLADTLLTKFEPEFMDAKAYTTMLPTTFYVGAEYILNSKLQVGALYRGEIFKKNYAQSATVYLNAPLTSWVSLHASYTIANHTFDNVGAGLTLRGGPLLWYFACDNVLGAVLPYKTRMTNIRMGLNFIFDYKQVNNRPRFKTY